MYAPDCLCIRVFVYSKMDFPARKKTDVDKKPGAML